MAKKEKTIEEVQTETGNQGSYSDPAYIKQLKEVQGYTPKADEAISKVPSIPTPTSLKKDSWFVKALQGGAEAVGEALSPDEESQQTITEVAEAFGAAASNMPTLKLVGKASQDLYASLQETEEGYSYTQDLDVLEGVPERLHHRFEDAINRDDVISIKTRLDQDARFATIQKEAGWTGTAASIIMDLQDPFTLAMGSGEMVALGRLAPKATRAVKTLATAGTGMATGAIEYGLRYLGSDKGFDTEDLLFNSFGGAVIGGSIANIDVPAKAISKKVGDVVDFFIPKKYTPDELFAMEGDKLHEANKNMQRFMNSNVVKKLRSLTKRKPTEDVNVVSRIDDLRDAPTTYTDEVRERIDASSEQFTFDDRTPAMVKVEKDAMMDLAHGKLKKSTTAGKLLSDVHLRSEYNMMVDSGSTTAQKWANDFLSTTEGVVNDQKTASGRHFTWIGKALQPMVNYGSNVKAYSKKHSKNMLSKRFSSWLDDDMTLAFDFEINKAIRAQEAFNIGAYTKQELAQVRSSVDELALETADKFMKGTQDSLQLQKMHNVSGANDIDDIYGYMPMHIDGANLMHLYRNNRPEFDDLYRGLRRGYIKALDLTEDNLDIADKLTQAIVEAGKNKAMNIDMGITNLLNKDGRQHMLEVFKVNKVTDPKVLDDLFDRLDNIMEQQGKAAHLKKRTDINLMEKLDNGKFLFEYMEKDMSKLFTRYQTKATGLAAMASKGIRSRSDFLTHKATIMQEMHSGGNGVSASTVDKIMDGVWDQFTGQPIRGGVNKVVRRATDMTSLLKLWGSGFAQIAETNTILARYGMRNMYNSVREFRPMWKMAREGEQATLKAIRKAKSELNTLQAQGIKNTRTKELEDIITQGKTINNIVEDMEVLLGESGKDYRFHRKEVRLTDAETQTSKTGARFDRALGRGLEIQNVLSGNRLIKEQQERYLPVMFVDKLIRMVKSGKMGKKEFERLRRAGITDDIIEGIKGNLDKVTFSKRGSVHNTNFNDWDNQDTVMDLVYSAKIHVSEMIQRPLIGENIWWMHSTTAKLLTQFRAYPIMATGKHLGRAIRHRDKEALAATLSGVGIGAISSLIRGYIEDRPEEYFEPENIVKKGMGYTNTLGMTTDFVGMVDMFTGIMPNSGGFRGAWQPPAVQTYMNQGKFLSGLIRAGVDDDYKWGTTDMKAFKSALLPNHPLLMRWFNGMENDRRKRSKSRTSNRFGSSSTSDRF